MQLLLSEGTEYLNAVQPLLPLVVVLRAVKVYPFMPVAQAKLKGRHTEIVETFC